MDKAIIDYIVNCMIHGEDTSIQEIQTEHRLKLAHYWGIKKGSRILEIGCGQGDMTAVLAYAAGKDGFIHAVDIASPAYGAPFTLGEASTYLKDSPLGKTIQFSYNLDLLSPDVQFEKNEFDYIIFSHCSWYFSSPEELQKLFHRTRSWGASLCFAEWDSRIMDIEQMPHLMAALIQAQYECWKEESQSNIRTLFTPNDIRNLIGQAGWEIERDSQIYSPMLQDAKWEVDFVLSEYENELKQITGLPLKAERLLRSQIDLLMQSSKTSIKPMSAYVCKAY
ncbi:class I SAM-dependent methyltransferase [Bacillus sp. 1P06AnD]|uniref:class I SAM-dependent methyltransferase n=1 Tax=Bacillus sp. 1P06AnD TaxID=3132208 RepID=UPI0039A10DC7